MTAKTHISVCICTFKRLGQLDGLLRSLEKQDTQDIFEFSIVVVDNDAFESARKIVESHAKQSRLVISYHVEPRQNIALARNKAIENAEGQYVGLIDDDEQPDSNWLFNLYKSIVRYESDGILGPVLPRFEIKPPKWVTKGRYFDRQSHSTGQILEWENTRTGNALIKTNLFNKENDRFRVEFGRGGEDRDFFRRMIKRGHVFVWCDEAPVYETVPPNRWRKKILIKRALLRGSIAFQSATSKPKSILTSAVALVVYSIFLPFLFILSPIIGFHIFMKYLIKDCDHLGKLLAFVRIDLVKEKYLS